MDKRKPRGYLYYGIEIDKEEKKNFLDLMVKGLLDIKSKFSQITEEDDLFNFIEDTEKKMSSTKWKYARTFHITTLFRQRKGGFNRNSPAYKGFKDGKKVDIDIKGLVYIPKKTIIFITMTNEATDNEYPHITCMVNQYKPKNSNDVFDELFQEGKEYSNVYKELKNNEQKSLIEQKSVKILDEKVNVYINIFEKGIKFNSTMKGFTF